MSALIQEIAGIGNSSDPRAEMKQRAGLVKDRTLVDTVNLSLGEAILNIRVQRAKMLAEYWQGTPLGERAGREFEFGQDVLFNGLHTGFRAFTGLFEKETAGVFSAIRSGMARNRPASGFFTWEEKRMQGRRTPLSGIGDPLVPIIDCNAVYPLLTFQVLLQQGTPAAQIPSMIQQRNVDRLKCSNENKYRKVLNDFMEKMSHHPLYYFEPNPNITPLVGGKFLDHLNFILKIEQDSKIPEALLREWLTNGVIRHNIKGTPEEGSAGPLMPLETIEVVKQEAIELGIGFPIWLIPVVVALIGVAASQTKNFIDVIKGDQNIFQALKNSISDGIQAIGNIKWGPEAGDWAGFLNMVPGDPSPDNPPPNDPPGATGINKNIIIGAALLGGGLLLSR